MVTRNFDLKEIIKRCKEMHRISQQQLFERLYSFGHQVSMRYTHNKEEADEVLSNAFLKVFLNIKKYDDTYDFLPWFKRIIINTAIDYIRKKKHELNTIELNIDVNESSFEDFTIEEDVEMLPLIQQLPTMYQAVFNLYVIEEYSHDEIGLMLGISASTSRSNLTRAKSLLKKTILSEASFTKLPLIRKLKID